MYGTEIYAFAVLPTVCTVNNMSAHYRCGSAQGIAILGSSRFVVTWSSTAERTQDATGGGIFSCNGGATRCKVGNDGLPVELLHFKVE
jgi:hypothetical protein